MAGPFPGMDPYLEDPAFWQDFHRRFITHCADYLGDRLPDSYEARIDERLRLIETSNESERQVLPDVVVTHGRNSGVLPPTGIAGGGSVATLEPVTIPMAVTAEVRDTWIEILHRPERSLVTVIELLSPTNKAGAGFGDYMSKRRAIREQHAHLLELDLLVGGQRIPLGRPLPKGDYYALLSRDERHPYVDVYAWSARDVLPTLPIPLRRPDADIPLDLGAVVGLTYERGRYARSLRYGSPPPAPLSADDAAWAQAVLKQAGRG